MFTQISTQSSDNNIPVCLSNPKSSFNREVQSPIDQSIRIRSAFIKNLLRPGTEARNPIYVSDEESIDRSSTGSRSSSPRLGREAENPIYVSDEESIDRSSTGSRSSSPRLGREAENPIYVSDEESIDRSSTGSRSSSISQGSSGGQDNGHEFPAIHESDEEDAALSPSFSNSPHSDHEHPTQSESLPTSLSSLSKSTELSSRCRGRPRLQHETFTLGGTLCQFVSAKPVADGIYELSIRATMSAGSLAKLLPSTKMNGLNRKKRKRKGIIGMRQSRRIRKERPSEPQEKGNSGYETELED